MKQVVQDRKTGQVIVMDVPEPQQGKGNLLVRVRASVISAGTESALVAATGRSLLQRIADKPELIKKGIDTLTSRGIDGLRNQIEGKYAGYEALGYSCAGEVIATDAGAIGIMPGMRVACGGIGYAHHAEWVSVPHRLCAVVPDQVDDETAAYATIGAIAMQGVRQSAAVLGENIVVIGLGLVGLIAVQLLRAAGCSVIGVDPSAHARNKGIVCGCRQAIDPSLAVEAVRQTTRGIGADAILICAATSSSDPVILAGELARSRGRVVMIGATGMEIPREQYFRKELSFHLSRSYGPGRYDASYEEEGIDYPIDYVRFTEQRNMQSFLDLAASGTISINLLTTHRFPLSQAPDAYALLTDKTTDRAGVVLSYPATPDSPASPRPLPPAATTSPGISFIGAGGYAENMLLPLFRSIDDAILRGIVTRQAVHAASVASRFHAAYSDTDANKVLTDHGTHVVFIATRHDSHATYAASALKAKKHVWIEKPMALTMDDVDLLDQLHTSSGVILTVGFNRRFSPLSSALKKALPEGSPVMVSIRVNAGHLPPDHWTQQRATGGGRLLGEGCHFFDYLCFVTGSEPVSVYTTGLCSERIDLPASSNFIAAVQFRNGSVGTVIYASEGSANMPKERIEVFSGNVSAVLDDFTTLTIHNKQGSKTETCKRQDKGQTAMLRSFMLAVQGKAEFTLSSTEVFTSSRLTLLAQQSLEQGVVVHMRK